MSAAMYTRYSLFNTDAHIQGAYSHKKFYIVEDISVSVGAYGVSFDTTIEKGHSDYRGINMPIYY